MNGNIYIANLYPYSPKEIDNFSGLKTININEDEETYILKGHSNSITDLIISEDGSTLLSSSTDGLIFLWVLTFLKIGYFIKTNY
jgi:WD40 repeat protein